MKTHNIPSSYRKSKRSLLCLLTWRYNQPLLARTTPVRTNFHGPNGVRAIEVRLYYVKMYLFTAFSVYLEYRFEETIFRFDLQFASVSI